MVDYMADTIDGRLVGIEECAVGKCECTGVSSTKSENFQGEAFLDGGRVICYGVWRVAGLDMLVAATRQYYTYQQMYEQGRLCYGDSLIETAWFNGGTRIYENVWTCKYFAQQC